VLRLRRRCGGGRRQAAAVWPHLIAVAHRARRGARRFRAPRAAGRLAVLPDVGLHLARCISCARGAPAGRKKWPILWIAQIVLIAL
jgi:hypothetical protein